MYCISQFCRICITNDGTLLHIHSPDNDNISYFDKLKYCQPHLICEKTSIMSFICKTCSIQLRNSYEFLKMCSNSKLILEDYIHQLESVETTDSNRLAELMEDNLNEVNKKNNLLQNEDNLVFGSEIEMIKLEPECDIKEIEANLDPLKLVNNQKQDKITNEVHKRISVIPTEKLRGLLSEPQKHKTPEINESQPKNKITSGTQEKLFQMTYNLQKTSNLVPTNRKITKQGLEIIALCPTMAYTETPVKSDSDLMNIKAEYDDDMDDTNESSQFSEQEDVKMFNFQNSHSAQDGYIFKSGDRKRSYYGSPYRIEDSDYLPVSVEIIENDTNLYQNNAFFTPNNKTIKQELHTIKKIKTEVKTNCKYSENTSTLPVLKIRINKNKFQIIGKKTRCKVCPSKVNRKTVYRCMKCFVPICLSHAVSFCPPCTNKMPKEFNLNQRNVVDYPFFKLGESVKKPCGYCPVKLNRKSRLQCNDCASHICGEHKKYLCEFCSIGYSCPIY